MNVAPIKIDHTFLNALRSPTTGRPLHKVDPFILSDGEEFWPCIDGIPFLRVGRDALRESVLSAIRDGNPLDALAMLLTDRKDDTIPPANLEAARRVAGGVATVGEAMSGLGYGAMAPYMYHRWCLPTYLSGLALLEAHAPQGARLFEVGCGMGHFLRSWIDNSGPAIGSDLVFSHLWLARRFVAPLANLVCFDANNSFPLDSQCADVSFSQDTFHYFRRKEHVLSEMRRVSSMGIVILGHVHNAKRDNFSAGLPLELDCYTACVRPSVVYDDEALTNAALTGVPAKPAQPVLELREAQAFAFACGEVSGLSTPRLTFPRYGTVLQLNPLITQKGLMWPSVRFEQEFASGWNYWKDMRYPPKRVVDAARAGMAGIDPECDWYIRRRVVLDLPEGWR